MNPKISVIIPAFNAEDTIERAVKSAVKQTYNNKEIIIVDDGSQDSTLKICEKLSEDYKDVFVVSQKNLGVSSARNRGIKLAKGTFIQFLDSDDTMVSNMLSKMVETQQKYSSDYVICGLNIIKDGKVLRTPHLENRNFEFLSLEDYEFIYPLLSAPCNKLFRKEYVTSFQPEISNGEDLLFNTEYLLNVKKISTVSESLYNVFLDNEESLNKSISITSIKSLLTVNKAELELMSNIFDYEDILLFNYRNRFRLILTLFQRLVVSEKMEVSIGLIKYVRNDRRFLQSLKKIHFESRAESMLRSITVHCNSLFVYTTFLLVAKIRGIRK